VWAIFILEKYKVQRKWRKIELLSSEADVGIIFAKTQTETGDNKNAHCHCACVISHETYPP